MVHEESVTVSVMNRENEKWLKFIYIHIYIYIYIIASRNVRELFLEESNGVQRGHSSRAEELKNVLNS